MTAKTETPRADHYRTEFKRNKETSELIEWLLDECGGVERENAALRERLKKAEALLQECRTWQAGGENGEPLGQNCWTSKYRDFMDRLYAVTKEMSDG
jgi:hypothetical protein